MGNKPMAHEDCPISSADLESAAHFRGVMKDIGDGDVSKGIENLRSVLTYVEGLRKMNHSIAEKMAYVIVAIAITGLFSLIWGGLKVLLSEK